MDTNITFREMYGETTCLTPWPEASALTVMALKYTEDRGVARITIDGRVEFKTDNGRAVYRLADPVKYPEIKPHDLALVFVLEPGSYFRKVPEWTDCSCAGQKKPKKKPKDGGFHCMNCEDNGFLWMVDAPPDRPDCAGVAFPGNEKGYKEAKDWIAEHEPRQ